MLCLHEQSVILGYMSDHLYASNRTDIASKSSKAALPAAAAAVDARNDEGVVARDGDRRGVHQRGDARVGGPPEDALDDRNW